MASTKRYPCKWGCGNIAKRIDINEMHEIKCPNNPKNHKPDEELAEILNKKKEPVKKEEEIPELPPEEPKKIGVDLASKLYSLHLMGAGLIQYNYNHVLKGFDTRVQRKEERYTDIYRAILEKHHIKLKLPPEYVLALEVSQDVTASSLARVMMPNEEPTKQKNAKVDIVEHMDIDW